MIGLGLTLASCSGASGAVIKPAATPLVCGDAAVLGTYPSDNTWHGAIVGPLFFSAFGPGKERAVIDDFDARSPTKVVIQPLDPLKARVKLQGWRCSTGDQLRFEYGASWNTPVAVLPPAGAGPNGTPVGYTGYMLFTAPGKWKLSVTGANGQPLGTAIFVVQGKA